MKVSPDASWSLSNNDNDTDNVSIFRIYSIHQRSKKSQHLRLNHQREWSGIWWYDKGQRKELVKKEVTFDDNINGGF